MRAVSARQFLLDPIPDPGWTATSHAGSSYPRFSPSLNFFPVRAGRPLYGETFIKALGSGDSTPLGFTGAGEDQFSDSIARNFLNASTALGGQPVPRLGRTDTSRSRPRGGRYAQTRSIRAVRLIQSVFGTMTGAPLVSPDKPRNQGIPPGCACPRRMGPRF